MPSSKTPTHDNRNNPRKAHENRTEKQLAPSSRNGAGSMPITSLVQSSSRPLPKRNAVANVEDIKSRAFRTEELTQRAHRFNYQLAIDLREILQAEFDTLEKFSADPKASIMDVKVALIGVSSKIISEVDKQTDVQRKIADAYQAMYQEVTNMSKKVVTDLETNRLTVDETAAATRLLSDVMNVIRETVDYWLSRPEVSQRKLNDLKREAPKDSMNLNEMFERLESQIKQCHKALEHPMAGAVSVSKEFAKLNIIRKNDAERQAMLLR